MKKIIKTISKNLFLVFLLIGCSMINLWNNQTDEVVMSIKNSSLTNQGAVVVIKGSTNLKEQLIFSSDFKISKLVNAKYEPLEYKIENVAWVSIGYPIKKNTSIELEIKWEYLYGKLEPGSYKLEKEYFADGKVDVKKTVATEFEIK